MQFLQLQWRKVLFSFFAAVGNLALAGLRLGLRKEVVFDVLCVLVPFRGQLHYALLLFFKFIMKELISVLLEGVLQLLDRSVCVNYFWNFAIRLLSLSFNVIICDSIIIFWSDLFQRFSFSVKISLFLLTLAGKLLLVLLI